MTQSNSTCRVAEKAQYASRAGQLTADADGTDGTAPHDPGAVRQTFLRDRSHSRLALAGIEPVVTIEDWAIVLVCSRREIERMRSSGQLPAPDLHVGKMPRWLPSTVRDWLATQTKPGHGRAGR
jgi:hypothetical protein